jgi:hypothetical protein
MAIYFVTQNSQQLLADFNARIAQREAKGKITTWERSTDGKYYTHKAPEWRKAWLKPVLAADRLTFNIIKPQNQNVTDLVYSYYHGHLIETFLNHFDQSFTIGAATALPAAGDILS